MANMFRYLAGGTRGAFLFAAILLGQSALSSGPDGVDLGAH